MDQKGFAPIILILIIAGALILAGGAWYLQKIQNGQPNTLAIQAPRSTSTATTRSSNSTTLTAGSSTIDISTWKTYRNEKYGFEFRYPSEWDIENAYPLYLNIVVYNEAPTTSESAESLLPVTKSELDYLKQNIKNSVSYNTETEDAESIKLDGKNAQFLTSYLPPGGIFEQQVLFFVGNDYIEIGVQLPLGPFSSVDRSSGKVAVVKKQIENRQIEAKTLAVMDSFNQILSTFKFIN